MDRNRHTKHESKLERYWDYNSIKPNWDYDTADKFNLDMKDIDLKTETIPCDDEIYIYDAWDQIWEEYSGEGTYDFSGNVFYIEDGISEFYFDIRPRGVWASSSYVNW